MAVKLTSQRYTTVDVNENKLIDVLDGTNPLDAVNRQQLDGVNSDVTTLEGQIGASNVWQSALRNEYVAGQTVRDSGDIITQGNITSDQYSIFNGIGPYALSPAPLGTAVAGDIVFAYVDGSTPLTVASIDQAANTVLLSDTPDRNFTLTYPPTNFGAPIGVSTREYIRNNIPYDGMNDVEEPSFALSNGNFNFIEAQGVYQSAHWIAILVNGEAWREHQIYLRGDVVDYIDTNSIPRLGHCGIFHTATNANAPFQSDAIQHEANSTFSTSAPWEPIGSAVDVSMGQTQAQDQLDGSDGNPVAVLGRGATGGRWFVTLGQGTSGVTLPGAERPNIGDNIAFGLNNAATSENYELVDISNDSPAAILWFEGDTVPAEITTLITGVGNIVHLFVTNLRTDLGQIDRFIFNADDFVINTDNQNIGHAHVSVIGKQDTLPPLNVGRVWTARRDEDDEIEIIETNLLSRGYIRREDAALEYNTLTDFTGDTSTIFAEDEYYYIIDTATIWEITGIADGGTEGAAGYDNIVATLRNLNAERFESVILDSASTAALSANRWQTTQSWQRANLLEKVDSLPTGHTTGQSVYLTTIDGQNDPGPYTYNATDSEWEATGGGGGGGAFRDDVWSHNTAYEENEIVFFENSLFRSRTDHTQTIPQQNPDVDQTNWDLIYGGLAEIDNLVVLNTLTPTNGNLFVGQWLLINNDTTHANNGIWEVTYHSATADAGTGHTTNATQIMAISNAETIEQDLGIDALKAQVHALEEELSQAQEYEYATEAAYVAAFLTERTDEIGAKTGTVVAFFPQFDPETNVFTTYARLTTAQWDAIRVLITANDIVIGFGPDSDSLIPFQLLSFGPNGHGTVSSTEATYEFKLRLIEAGATYSGTAPIANATHKTQFESWATNSPTDAPQDGLYYYAEESANIDTIGHAVGNHLVNVTTVVAHDDLLDGATELRRLTVGSTDWNILNDNKNTILDNLDAPDTSIDWAIPAAATDAGNDIYVVDLANYRFDGGSGELKDNDWSYRPTITSSDIAAEAPASWDVLDTSDLDASDTATNNQRYIIGVRGNGGDGDTGLTGIRDQLNAGISFVTYNGSATTISTDLSTVDSALLYISDGTPENAAVLRVWYAAGNPNFNVWLVVEEVVSSVGVPPLVTGGIRISNAMQTHMEPVIVEPSFVGNLNLVGNTTINGNLIIGDSFISPGSTVTEMVSIPGGDNLTTFAPDASQSGSADNGGWYWRGNQSDSGSVSPNPITWADLVQGDGVSNANSDEWHILIARPADAAQITLLESISTTIGTKIANSDDPTDASLGSLFVSDGTNDNYAQLEVAVSPDNAFSTTADVRFRIKRVIASRGVPPVNQNITVSDTSVDAIESTIVDTAFSGNLDITGNLAVVGDATFTSGEIIRDWPTVYTESFTTGIGSYWEFDNRVWRATEAISVTSTDTLTGSNPATDGSWELITKDLSVVAGTGITVEVDAATNGLTTTTVSSDTILNRAEVTVPTAQDRILRTGEVQNIETFEADAIDRSVNVTLDYDADNTPGADSMSWTDANSAGNATTDFAELTHIRVSNTNVAGRQFFNIVREPFIATWQDGGNIDRINWALLRIPAGSPFDNVGQNGFSVLIQSNTVKQLPIEVLAGEFNGDIQTSQVRLFHNNAGFIAQNILRFIEPTFNTGTGATDLPLDGGGVFDLEETGIITETELDTDGDPRALGNTNTQFSREGTGNATATVHHQPMDSMAYLALQFNSVFAGVRGQVTDPVTPQNAAITDNTRDVDLHVYIEYLSTYNNETQNVTFVDRVRLSDGETQTRMYDSAAPAAFSPGGEIINQR